MQLWKAVGVLCACAFAVLPLQAADPTSSPVPPGPKRTVTMKQRAAKPPTNANRPLPFRGTIKTVNKAAKSFTIGERAFLVVEASKLNKQKKALEFGDLAAGDWVTGTYRKATNGTLVVNTLYHGGKLPVSNLTGTNATRTATNKLDAAKAKAAQ